MTKKEMELLNNIMNGINSINSQLTSLEDRVLKLEKGKQVSAPKTTAKTSTKSSSKKSAPAKSAELVEFTKKDGTTVTVSAKQAAAWEAYRDRAQNRMSLEELKAIPAPKLTKQVKDWVKTHPSCSAKEVKAQFASMKGLRREQLAALKVELGLR